MTNTTKVTTTFPYTYIANDGKHKTVHGVCFRCGYRITRKRNLTTIQEKKGARKHAIHTRCLKTSNIW